MLITSNHRKERVRERERDRERPIGRQRERELVIKNTILFLKEKIIGESYGM